MTLTTFKTLHRITVILHTIRYTLYLHESFTPDDNIMTLARLRLKLSKATGLPLDYRLAVVGELACLNTVGGFPPVGLALTDRSKGRGQTN